MVRTAADDDRGSVGPGANFALVQAMRGIAALWVVLFHASEGRHIDALKAALPRAVDAIVFDAGHYGVAIFFALSGFVITHSLGNVTLDRAFLWRFALRRSIRLDPPYWLSIAAVLGLAWLSAIVKHEAFAWPSPGTVAAHVLYLQVLLREPPINVVYWTLTYEVQFYLFLALMLVMAAGLSRRMHWRYAPAAAWATMAGLAFAAAFGWFNAAPVGVFLNLWSSFFVGVLGYRARRDRASVVVFALLVATMMLTSGSDLFARISAATAVVLSVELATGRIRRELDWRWLQFLGAISYSLYLLHQPLTGAAGFLVHRYLGEGMGASLIALVAIVAVSVAGATVFWATVERASQRLSRRVAIPKNVAQRDGKPARA